jgi:hypothetical protein
MSLQLINRELLLNFTDRGLTQVLFLKALK